MNQILQVKDTKQLKAIGAKKILLFLLLAIILLGLGIGGYFVYENVASGNIKLPIYTQTPTNTIEPDVPPVIEVKKPEISLSVVANDIKITVTSEVELKEITYKWNSENEKRENMITYEDRLSFEKQLEIPIGQNTLTIVAIDINGGITEKVQEIKGVTKATTTTEVVGEYLHFTVTGKENIETVEFEFNGQRFLMNTETFGETKKVHYKVKLVEGKNYLKITSTTKSGGIDVSSWEEEYTK